MYVGFRGLKPHVCGAEEHGEGLDQRINTVYPTSEDAPWLRWQRICPQWGDPALIPGSGRSPGEGKGNPLQYSCLENPMGRGAWWATVMGLQRVGHDWVTKHVATELADRCQVNQMTSLSPGFFRTVGQIMDWISMSLYKFICWNPNLRGALMHGICALIKKIPESSLAPSTMWGHRRQRPSGAGSRLLWHQNLSEHWTWNPSPLELWEIYFCCL